MGDSFTKIDSGLYVPAPPDQKPGVLMTAFGPGWTTTLHPDFGDLDAAVTWLADTLEDEAEWAEFTHAVMGTKVYVTRRLLEHVDYVGLEWHDIEEIKRQQELVRVAKLQARPRRNGR